MAQWVMALVAKPDYPSTSQVPYDGRRKRVNPQLSSDTYLASHTHTHKNTQISRLN